MSNGVELASELINVSENIRRLRELNGYSQRSLAKRLNTSHPVIVRWEQPITNITLGRLRDLAELFDVTMFSFFYPPKSETN